MTTERALKLAHELWDRWDAHASQEKFEELIARTLDAWAQEARLDEQKPMYCGHPYACRSGTSGAALICIVCREQEEMKQRIAELEQAKATK
jgi:hypothetical protein